MAAQAALISRLTPIGTEIASIASGFEFFCEFKTEKLGRAYRRDLIASVHSLCLQINAVLSSEMIEWE
ncbi:hypothetical protein FBZ93_101541 [Bradyrhizobium macuxiense]|uniref:Uncharacterized protein n=2 Tax=Bradyrhizobium macuxiense TaxID=1755647 RepID=A0A560MIV6_9BRAD|nr:hypothetical protein FBZ93_101541 [Bradyrhizobium macuxiense]